MKKHIGSTLAIIFGILLFLTSFSPDNTTETSPVNLDYLHAGLITIIGAFAYRSAKKRKLSTVESSTPRKVFEIIGVFIILYLTLANNNLLYHMATEPVTAMFIPLWAIIAYIVMSFRNSVKLTSVLMMPNIRYHESRIQKMLFKYIKINAI